MLVGLLLIVFTSVLPALALNPQKPLNTLMHRVWRSGDGLPQVTIRCLAQTRDGYLWLGTPAGLVRFDGVRFTVFDMQNTPVFKHNTITSLYEDHEGTLWIGTLGGLLRYRDGVISPPGVTIPYFSPQISAVIGGRDGSLWLGSQLVGVGRMKESATKVYGVLSRPLVGVVNGLWEGKNGTLWIATNRGVFFLRDTVATLLLQPDFLPVTLVRTILEDHEGTIWIGTYGRGLVRIAHGTSQVFTERDGLADNRVNTLFEGADGTMWIGTDGGLTRWYRGTFSRYTMKDGLSSNRVRAVLVDREDILWIGTEGGGLNRLQEGKFTSITGRNGLTDELVRSVLVTRDGALWIGTDGGGLHRVFQGSVKVYTTKDGLPNDMIRAMTQARDGSLWVGTYGGQVSILRNGRFVPVALPPGANDNFPRRIFQDSHGDMWIGTNGQGVIWIHNGTPSVLSFTNGLLSPVVQDVIDDGEGGVWLATNYGLNHLRNGQFLDTYPMRVMVYKLYLDNDGTLWFGTYGGGLGRLRSGQIKFFGLADGMHDNAVLAIAEDRSSNLWLSSSKGIARVAKHDIEEYAAGRIPRIPTISFSENDGLESNECTGSVQPSVTRAADGRLWFPTVKGVVMVNPDSIPFNGLPPPVLIERLQADDEALATTGEALAPPGDGRLEISYTALSLVAPEQVRFRYILEGFDKAWVEAGRRRAAYYTNLPPGTYRFRVTACNNDGVWNPTGQVVTVTLAPHYYQTWYFYCAALAFIIVGALFAYRLRVRQLRERERVLSLRVHERTLALQQEILERKKTEEQLQTSLDEKVVLLKEIHHRVKNNLQVINSLLSLQASLVKDETALEYFKESQNRVRSMAIIHERLYRSKDIARIDAGEYFRMLIASIFRSYQVETRIELVIKVHNINLDLDTAIPAGLIINELVSNALKYAFPIVADGNGEESTEPQGTIAVVLQPRGEKELELSVTDNGIGLPEAIQPANTQTLGLSLVNILTEQLGGILHIDRTLGTRIAVLFPQTRA